jgi:outer membrane protein assembly factor BamA
MSRPVTYIFSLAVLAVIFAQPLRAQSVPCSVPQSTSSAVAQEVPVQQTVQPGSKIVVADLKFEGEIHDAEIVRARLLAELKGREFNSGDSESLGEFTYNQVENDFQRRGYFEIQIGDPRVQVISAESSPNKVRVVVPVMECERYLTGKISVVGEKPEDVLTIPEDELRAQFHLSEGEIFNVDELREGMQRLSRIYGAKGFMDTTISPEFWMDHKTHAITTAFHVHEGRKYYVERFDVRGLDNTTTSLLESKIQPGSIYDNSQLEKLFELGRSTVKKSVSADDVVQVHRNAETATVDIIFDFSANAPHAN